MCKTVIDLTYPDRLQAVFLCKIVGCLYPLAAPVRYADEMCLTALVNIIEHRHYLLNGNVNIISVQKENVNVVRSENFKAVIYIFFKVFPAQSVLVHMTHRRVTALCRKHDLVTVVSRFHPAPDDTLTRVVSVFQPVAVYPCSVHAPAAKLGVFVQKLKISLVIVVSFKITRAKGQRRDLYLIFFVFQRVFYHRQHPRVISLPLLTK